MKAFRCSRILAICVFFALLGGRAEAGTAIVGSVKNKAGQPLPGLVLLEKGEIHNNVWDRGTPVGADGRFRIELPAGGQYGLHVYSSGYIYSPNPVQVEAGKTLEVNVTLVPEPTRANDPIIVRVDFAGGEAKKPVVQMEVTDPNGDLGPQVLAFNAATGRAYAMSPPRPVRDLKANFPAGIYRLEVPDFAPLNPRDWHFVLADHKCNTTDILSYPHRPTSPKTIGR